MNWLHNEPEELARLAHFKYVGTQNKDAFEGMVLPGIAHAAGVLIFVPQGTVLGRTTGGSLGVRRDRQSLCGPYGLKQDDYLTWAMVARVWEQVCEAQPF